jgi:hypothetical protein
MNKERRLMLNLRKYVVCCPNECYWKEPSILVNLSYNVLKRRKIVCMVKGEDYLIQEREDIFVLLFNSFFNM